MEAGTSPNSLKSFLSTEECLNLPARQSYSVTLNLNDVGPECRLIAALQTQRQTVPKVAV